MCYNYHNKSNFTPTSTYKYEILFDLDNGELIPRLVKIFVSLRISQSDSGAGKVSVRSDQILVYPVSRPGVSSPGSRVDSVIILGVLLHVSLGLQVVHVFKSEQLNRQNRKK